MKKLFACFSAILILASLSITASAQKKQMTWTTNSDKARDVALKGAEYMMNIEFPQAYEAFLQAVKEDPEFTVVLVFLSNMTVGETRKDYTQRAIKSASNKTEGEKLLVTLLDEKGTIETRRDIWARLHQMFPDGGMIENYYVSTRATPQERMTAGQEYLKKYPAKGYIHNLLGYFYMNDLKDNATAKMHFEKYIELYPDGYNPYDSMGEFYFNTGDMVNSEKYYTMALERYPFNTSSIQKIDEIVKAKKAKAAN
jgi:Pre-mRNA 3''-end processing (cleavage and polyadenylation) factor